MQAFSIRVNPRSGRECLLWVTIFGNDLNGLSEAFPEAFMPESTGQKNISA